MCDKIKRILMMEYNAEEVHQRRKRLWLTYGRALFTIGILGFLTIALYAASQNFWQHSHDDDAQISQMVTSVDENSEINRIKRSNSENEIIPKDDSENLVVDERSVSRRQQASNDVLHRHSDDGGIYIFKGYKCIPISKPSKQLENLRARHRVGMCVHASFCLFFIFIPLLFCAVVLFRA